MSINFEDSSNHLPQKLLVVGIGASKIIKKAKKAKWQRNKWVFEESITGLFRLCKVSSVPDITEKSTELQCVSEKSAEESNSRVILHDAEIENEDVILVANLNNDQGAQSSQTVELLERPLKKKEANANNEEKGTNANIFIFYTLIIKIWSLTIGKDVWNSNKRSLKVTEI